MTQAGGPAAINGFLYQIIQHLGWLAEVRLSGKLNGQEVVDAQLVLEPRNGGDARAEAAGQYLVEQYKTRSDGTWALSDIQSVLRDLRKSVPSSLPPHARYRFVTDGRAGRLATFLSFLKAIKQVGGRDELDDTKIQNFGAGSQLTYRDYFDHLVVATRSATLPQAGDEQAITFHLLAHFDMDFSVAGIARAASIESLLRPYVPNLGDEPRVRQLLVGKLLERLSKGETRLDGMRIEAIFREAELNPDRLRKLAELPFNMAALTHSRLERIKYRFDRDVRTTPYWPIDKSVLVIAGESGSGKTWQLGRLLYTLGQEREIAVLITAATDRADLLIQASRDLWQFGLTETSETTLIAFSHRLRELYPNGGQPKVVIALDDVQDVNLAQDIVNQDWGDWGMRLAITVPRWIAQALQQSHENTVHVHVVSDFSVDELVSLLKKNGRSWVELPADLKKILRNPVLAGLYLDLPYASFQAAPRSEYEIFENYWQRITRAGRGDAGILMEFAARLYTSKTYPLPRPQWQEIGLDEQAVARIEATGWLRITESGEAVLAHDRLLNWAAAKYLAHQIESKQIKVENLGTYLTEDVLGTSMQQLRSRLGYVPMDLMWLLAEKKQSQGVVGRFVTLLENSRIYGSYGEDLYQDHLPSLGQIAIPILLDRLREIIAASAGDYRVQLIGKAFMALAKQENIDLDDTLGELLQAQEWDRQAVALPALTVSPNIRHLDRLWDIHQRGLAAIHDKMDGRKWHHYEESFAAMRAGIAANPGWLQNRILASDPEIEPISELGYLLNNLEHPEAPTIWSQTKDVLFKKVSPSKPRSLLNCITRFRDHEKLDYVLRHLSTKEDFACGSAFTALAVLDPITAIDKLAGTHESELYFFRSHWLPILLQRHPDLTRRKLLELAEANSEGARFIENIFNERPDDMNEAMLRFILHKLTIELQQRFDECTGGEPHWLNRPLALLGSIVRKDFLAILEEEAGCEFERMLTEIAYAQLRTNSRVFNHLLDRARRVLILIGGEGLTWLLRKELESEHYWVRHGGLRWAYLRNDPGIVERLATIARHPISSDADGKQDTNGFLEFHQAVTMLAALGADDILVNVIYETGRSDLPSDLDSLRANRGPMPKSLTQPTLSILQSQEPDENSLLTALVVAWLSNDADFIPVVRSVLERANPEGKVAGVACIALQTLGDRSDEFVLLATRLAATKGNSVWGLNSLLSIGPQGREPLANWLKNRRAVDRSHQDIHVIHALYDNPETRSVSIDAAVECCLSGRYPFNIPYEIAAEKDHTELREKIFETAFLPSSMEVSAPLRAIEGLAKFDPQRALEAIEAGLHNHPKIERQLCQLFARISPETAAAKLIEFAVSADRESLWRVAGQTLRRLDPETVATSVIERMKGASSQRKAAAELASWIVTPAVTDALGHLADNDSASEVRHTALKALDLHRREANLLELFAAFPAASFEKRWSLLLIILEHAAPHLLTDREDKLWLGNIFNDDVPTKFVHYARAALKSKLDKN